jgi:hypothetical protein
MPLNLRPDLVWDVDGKAAPRPSEDHRRGFAVNLWIEGCGLRELCSTSGALIGNIIKLYDQFEAAPEAARGLLPLVEQTDLLEVQNQFGQFYDPQLDIRRWVPRPSGRPQPAAKPPPAPKAASPAAVPTRRSSADLNDEIPF